MMWAVLIFDAHHVWKLLEDNSCLVETTNAFEAIMVANYWEKSKNEWWYYKH